jgi:hypothetical protein
LFSSAVASASVRPLEALALPPLLLPPPKPRPPTPLVEVTVSRFVPSESILLSTADEEPVPTAISTITDPTPIVKPRIVSPERNLLAASPLSATRAVSIASWPPPRTTCGSRVAESQGLVGTS